MVTELRKTDDRRERNEPSWKPWCVTSTGALDQMGSAPERGLSSSEAERRRGEFGPNELDPPRTISLWERVVRQLREPFVLLLLIAAAIALAAWVLEGASGAPLDVWVIGVVVVANTTLGVWQELRAAREVQALRRMTAVTARVRRDGQETTIPAPTLVPGDIILVGEGDAVSTDARLIESTSLTVVESSLTGESEPVTKNTAPLPDVGVGDRTNMLHSGTAVAAGHGVAVVCTTGMSTEVGRIARLVSQSVSPPSPLERELDRTSRSIGKAVGVATLIVVAAILGARSDLSVAAATDALLVGVSLAVAAVPEGLPAVLSLVLALGVRRMASRRALVKELSLVEALGSADVICTDKTGTLTTGQMTVMSVATRSGDVALTGRGFSPDGRATVVTGEDGPVLTEVVAALQAAALASNAGLERDASGTWTAVGDPTEAALVVADHKLRGADASSDLPRVHEIPFDADRKMMTVVIASADQAGYDVITKGAPDVLLRRCTAEFAAGSPRPLDGAGRHVWMTRVDAMAGRALRTIAVATRRVPEVDGVTDSELEDGLILLGVVGMIDPLREEAAATVATARRAGVHIVMLTGDHPQTARAIGVEVGLLSPDATVRTGEDLEGLTDGQLVEELADHPVVARVSPRHKHRVVTALQAVGHTVAMTGDGVNDAPALRRADIGVAMGLTGTEVAREAADIILTDDDLATLLDGIAEGRQIFENIKKFLRYLLPSNTAEVLVMLLGVLAAAPLGLLDGGVAAPLLATQILWINLVTDSGMALALGVDSPVDDVMQRPPRGLTDRVLDGEMGRVIGLTGLVMALVSLIGMGLETPGGLWNGTGTVASARTQTFTIIVLCSVIVAFNSRSSTRSARVGLWDNRLLWAAALGALVLQVMVVQIPAAGHPFGTVPMTAGQWLRCVGLAAVVLVVEEARKWRIRRRS